ncbi:unnamed protein product [Mytilus coruscus]|uniref:CCHC-type domain-containing protein n=1 Tax=Mytilus coruscus TaxID=42192 RepID=A0A6J8CQS1_MYTCO|nr:unnamed protein product [Mytilus coruscus]
MDKSIKKHRKKIKNKISNLKSNNPKEYWRILNINKASKTPFVQITVLFDFFKDLNDGENVENENPTESHVNVDSLNVYINSLITRDQVENALKGLKNNKESANCHILRVQKDIDTFEEYLTDLKILVKDCGYATPEEMVRDAIVFGTKDHKVREKCITEGSELTLEKAINFARTYELSKAQLKSMESEDKTINMLNKQGSRSNNFTSGKKYGKQYTLQRGPPQNNKGQSPNFANKCKNCGGKHERRKCPAFGKQCNKCHKYNHFVSVCLSSNKSTKKMHTLDICSESDDDELFVATVDD